MEDQIIKKYLVLDKFNVSRETFLDFEKFISMLIIKNENINIISSKNREKSIIRQRHIIDSAQILDFVDLNTHTTYDIGSGGGLPGLVIAIMAKNLKKTIKFTLYEKSYHKCQFLEEVSKKLKLQTEIIQEDIFLQRKLKTGTIMSRAFKPLPVVLELVYKNFSNYNNLILFMGKNGKQVLNDTKREWDFEYKEKESLTNKDSFLLNIKNIKKKFLN